MFGDRIKELRIRNYYSMYKLVEIYNKQFDGKLNKSTISRYENGLQEPMFTTVKNFAKLFSVTTDYLTETTDSDSVVHGVSFAPDEHNIIKKYRQLSDESKRKVRENIDDLLLIDNIKLSGDIKLVADQKKSIPPIVDDEPRHT